MKQELSKLNTSDFVGYIDVMAPTIAGETKLGSVFPLRLIPGLDYSYAKTTKGVVELTYPSAYDAEPIAQNRESFDAFKGDLPLFRRKTTISEKEEAQLMSAMAMGNPAAVDQMIAHIYDDKFSLVRGAMWTQEFMRARALMHGKIVMQSAGGSVAIDYGVPADNKYALVGTDVWSDENSPILDQIKEWIEKVWEETGVKPDTLLLNMNTFKYLTKNLQVRNNLLPISILVNAVVSSSLAMSDAQIAETVKAVTGLKEIIVYNHKVQIENTVYDLVEDNKIALFPSTVKMGDTLVGTSPAELSVYKYGNDAVELTADGIAVAVVHPNGKGAPYTTETQVEFVCIPSLMGSDFLVIADVA